MACEGCGCSNTKMIDTEIGYLCSRCLRQAIHDLRKTVKFYSKESNWENGKCIVGRVKAVHPSGQKEWRFKEDGGTVARECLGEIDTIREGIVI